ncbi:lamin tail domain-containing protein [Candidatus Poribacteria bacterium]|nr:lamin tail domain-containing protein [Candidatus Poribacteria bacterium]
MHNAAHNANDYIELKNISDTAVRLRDWEVSLLASEGEAPDEDVGIVSFPDYTLSVGGALLITNTDPDETVIIDGLNITPHTTEATEAEEQRGAQHPYLVAHGLNLPSTPYLLILRHARGKSGTREAIEDVAGNYFNNTGVWPLAYSHHPSVPVAPLSETGTYQRKDARQPGYIATAWTVNRSPPGLLETPNTLEGGEKVPLFAPDAHAAAVVFNPTLPDEVRITELMFETQGPSGPLSQWIELYNASATPVDLEGWQLGIETRTAESHRHALLTLTTFSLPPKQTVILAAGQGNRRPRTLPANRVYDLTKAHADVFSRHLDENTIIGTDGFFVELIHPTGRVVDCCGNLDGDKDTDDLPTWTLPDSKTLQGHRSSLLRRFEGDVCKGTEAAGWIPAMAVAIGVNTYYGHPTDISTPGFLHQIVPGASPTTALSISEIMFETQIRTRPLPQWIELYNPSFTHSVKLKDYQLLIETRQEGNQHQQIVMTLEAFDVLPNQTVLLITHQGRHSRHLRDHLIYDLSQRHPKAFLRLPNRSRLLSRDGFLIQLRDDSGNVVDTVGNLDGYPSTEDTPAYALPPGETSDGERASLRRLSEKQRPLDGRYAEAWVSTADVPSKIITYYGHASDVGNPGYRKGGPLPVTLSSFSATWRTDTVQITWATESELDNAGFNILRSRTKEGEFQQVNTQLIQGAGTTSERNAYTWTDTTAKPNTVYYYRIEDVSHAGERKQLATVRIRGLVSPNGKLITRWADVKN